MVMPVAPGGPASPAPAGSSVSMQSPSQGSQVSGMAKVRQCIKLLEKALSDVGAESELGAEILKSIKGLSSKAPANKTTAGAEATQLQTLAAQAKQSAPLLALQRAQGGQPRQAEGQPNG